VQSGPVTGVWLWFPLAGVTRGEAVRVSQRGADAHTHVHTDSTAGHPGQSRSGA